MKRTKLTVRRERLRNLTFAEMRKAGGGLNTLNMDGGGDTGGTGGTGGGDGGGGGDSGCDDRCADNTLSFTITHERSYQVVNTIC